MQNNVVLHVRARISATSMSSRPVANPSQSCRNAEARYRSTSFFSSSLADVALRLGPYMSISCQKDICTRTQWSIKAGKSKQTNKHTGPTTTTTRKSPSQICVSSRENSKPDKNGARPKQTTTTKRICQRTQRIHHCATTQKLAK